MQNTGGMNNAEHSNNSQVTNVNLTSAGCQTISFSPKSKFVLYKGRNALLDTYCPQIERDVNITFI